MRGVVKRVPRRLLAVAHYLAGSDWRLLPLTGRQTTLVAIRSLRQHCHVTCHMPHAPHASTCRATWWKIMNNFRNDEAQLAVKK